MDGSIIPAWLRRDQWKKLGCRRVQTEEDCSKTGLKAVLEHEMSDFQQN